jgi:hypothetical protein
MWSLSPLVPDEDVAWRWYSQKLPRDHPLYFAVKFNELVLSLYYFLRFFDVFLI